MKIDLDFIWITSVVITLILCAFTTLPSCVLKSEANDLAMAKLCHSMCAPNNVREFVNNRCVCD